MEGVQYILGHSDAELHRLDAQGAVLKPLTTRLLAEVGLAEGMSVLDIGTGGGDVAMIAGSVVGPRGRVVGLDRSHDAIEHARRRAGAAGRDWVEFHQVDFGPELDLGTFDVVVGRFVLVHQPKPAEFLHHASRHVRDGGALAVIEIAQAREGRFSVPEVASYDEALDGLLRAFEAANANLDIGSCLASVFAQAHLPSPALLAEVPVGTHSSSIPEWVARTAQSVGQEPAWSPLADRIRRDVKSVDAQIFGPRSVAGWVRL